MYRGKFSWERAFIFWSLKHPLLAFYIKLHDPGTLTPHHILFHLSNMIYWSHATHKRASARFKNNLTISIRMTVSREQAHVCYQCERSLLSDSLLAPLPPLFFFFFSPSLRHWKVRSPWQMLGPLDSFVVRRRWSTWSSFRQRGGGFFVIATLSRKQFACPLYRREENKR